MDAHFYMENSDYRIRKVIKEDLPEIKDICKFGFPQDDAFEIAKTLIDTQHYFVAEEISSKKILGFIAFGIHSIQASHIIILAVDNKYQRNGIGTTLLDFALEIISKTNSNKVRLEVRVTNSNAIRFYEKNGFQIQGRLKEYYDDLGDGYLMIKQLKNEDNSRGVSRFKTSL